MNDLRTRSLYMQNDAFLNRSGQEIKWYSYPSGEDFLDAFTNYQIKMGKHTRPEAEGRYDDYY